MRFATYEYRNWHHVAVVEEDGTLYPLPGADSLTGLLTECGGLPGLPAAGSALLGAAPGPHVSEVRLLPPLQPPTVRDFVTFVEHVEGVRLSVDGTAGVPEQFERAGLRAGGRRRDRAGGPGPHPRAGPRAHRGPARSSTTGPPVIRSPPR